MEISDFSIANDSKKTFKLLTQGLFKDPLKGAIREVVLNAIHAIEASNNDSDEPLLLVTYGKDRILEVSDRGNGIPKRKLLEITTEFFKSEQLGLGFKAPFAISNTFDIISKEKFTTTYATAYISEEGLPSITFTKSENSCNEETGTTIRIPISKNFGKSYQVFYVIMAVLGEARFNSILNYEGGEYNFSAEKAYKSIMKPLDDSESNVIEILMDRVAYAIDIRKLSTPMFNTITSIRNCKFRKDINFPIILSLDNNSLEVTPSKEDIVYSEDAIAKIEGEIKKTVLTEQFFREKLTFESPIDIIRERHPFEEFTCKFTEGNEFSEKDLDFYYLTEPLKEFFKKSLQLGSKLKKVINSSKTFCSEPTGRVYGPTFTDFVEKRSWRLGNIITPIFRVYEESFLIDLKAQKKKFSKLSPVIKYVKDYTESEENYFIPKEYAELIEEMGLKVDPIVIAGGEKSQAELQAEILESLQFEAVYPTEKTLTYKEIKKQGLVILCKPAKNHINLGHGRKLLNWDATTLMEAHGVKDSYIIQVGEADIRKEILKNFENTTTIEDFLNEVANEFLSVDVETLTYIDFFRGLEYKSPRENKNIFEENELSKRYLENLSLERLELFTFVLENTDIFDSAEMKETFEKIKKRKEELKEEYPLVVFLNFSTHLTNEIFKMLIRGKR